MRKLTERPCRCVYIKIDLGNELMLWLLLIFTLVAQFAVSIVFGIQYTSSQNFLYKYSTDASLLSDPRRSDSGIYNVIYNITSMGQEDHGTSLADATQKSDPRDTAIITMQRNGTANGLPVYSLTLYAASGKVVYKGIKNVDKIGVQTYQIPKSSVRELVDYIISIYFVGYKDKYNDNSSKSSNLPIVTTSINYNGTIKTILDDHNSYAPLALRSLEDKIDQFTNSSQWIGPKRST